jgi:hypothetical protein
MEPHLCLPKSTSAVLMMKSAEKRPRDDPAEPLNGTMFGADQRGGHTRRVYSVQSLTNVLSWSNTAPLSSWRNGPAERLVGPMRRECLDHVVDSAKPS